MNQTPISTGLKIILMVGMLFCLAGPVSTLAQIQAAQTAPMDYPARIVPEMPDAVDALPVADNQAVSTNEEAMLVIHLTATDEDDDPLTYTIVTEPASGALNGIPPNLNYTPNLDFFGMDSFTFKVNDGSNDSNLATVSITVTNVYDLPVPAPDAYETALDTPLVVSTSTGVLANDYNPDQATLTVIQVDNADHGILTLRDDGSLVYKPDNGYTGIDTFTYHLYDGIALSQTVTVTIAVNLGNTPPIAAADVYDMYSGTALTVDAANGLLSNDSDVDLADVLTARLIGGVAFGTLTFHEDGSFVYVPNPYYLGDDHFTYQAYDGEAYSISAMVTIHVTINPNKAPVAVADSYTMDTGVDLTVDCVCGVLNNDSDVNGDVLTAQLVGNPVFGSLTLNEDGSFVYVPDAGFIGADQFTYQAFDGEFSSNLVSATIVVTVNAPNHIYLPSVIR